MRSILIIAFTFAFALAVGCGKKDDDKSGKAKPTAGETKQPKGTDTPKPPTGDDPKPPGTDKAVVVTEADFEEEAAKEITTDNLEKQLGALEEELED